MSGVDLLLVTHYSLLVTHWETRCESVSAILSHPQLSPIPCVLLRMTDLIGRIFQEGASSSRHRQDFVAPSWKMK